MTKTLFSRYKDMINNKWAAGERTYTSSELNRYVGGYENPTMWKRCSNNHFYATRTYQTLLKDFGCITMIKRGLWQINAPIPEWFGSFHFNGLKGGFDLSNPRGDHGCIYWKALPAHQKVNPWKNIDPKSVMASTNPADDCTTIHAKIEVVEECAVYTISGIPATSKIPGLTATYNLNVWRETSGVVDAEVTDWTFTLNGEEICQGIKLLAMVNETHTSAAAIAKKRAIDAYTADRKGQPTQKMYTEAQVKQFLESFGKQVQDNVLSLQHHYSATAFK